MKLNKKNKRLVQNLVKHYCKKLKIDIPKITIEILYPRHLEEYDHWGLYIFADDLLYINLKIHTDENGLRNTITHELIHKKFKRLEHGPKFNAIVDKYF
jgi:predicted metal-dependent hydrolase